MKRIFALLLIAAILLTAVPWSISIQAQAAGNERYTVLVLDVSGSKDFQQGNTHLYTAETAVEYVKESAITFLRDMNAASGNNYVAVVTYASDAEIISDFTPNMTGLSDRISDIYEIDDSSSNITDGLEKAHSLINSISNPDATKNVVLFTTGMCNEGSNNYTGQYGSDTIGSSWYRIDTGVKLYAYSNVAYEAATRLKEDAKIYTLGIFQTMQDMPEAGREIADFFIMLTRDLASDESCFYNVADPSELEFAFGEIADNITATRHTFKYPGMINKNDTVSDCYYTDSYFLRSANIYNASLATMSLCLEYSSWSSNDKQNWYDPDITIDDPDYWEDRLVNAKKLLLGDPAIEGDTGLGFSDFAANEDWQADPEMNSIGVCLAQKTIKDRMGDDCTLVAVVIRGGGYGSEWGGNFNVGFEGAHKGFAIARDTVLEFTREYIGKLDSEAKKNMKLWIVGYSRGGATANMVAGALNDNCWDEIGVSIDSENIYCYTFEAPQGVLNSQTYGSSTNIHNVLNVNDLVPFVAPSAWEFTRYACDCELPHYFPSRYTTDPATFAVAKLAMQQQLEEMGFTQEYLTSIKSDFVYSIEEYSSVPTVHIDWWHILPGGKPLSWTEESLVPTYEVLSRTVDFLATDVFPNRDYYSNNVQDSLTMLVSEIMHYDKSVSNAKKEEIKDMLSAALSADNLVYILSPMLSPNPFYTPNARTLDVQQRLDKVLRNSFRDLEGSEELLTAIEDVLTRVILQLAEEVSCNNTDSINLLLQAVEVFGTTGFQPHYPEVTLAWCRSLDPNYNSALVEAEFSTQTRVVRINCPVNVQIYDTAGVLVAEIIEGVPSENNQLLCYVNTEGEKIFYLPGDADYHIDIQAIDDGMVNYSVNEYDFAYNSAVAAYNYYDIPVSEGDHLTAEVQVIPPQSNTNGSGMEYLLWHNGNLQSADEIIVGMESQRKYDITVQTEGSGGYAEGTGRYTCGSFAQVEAHTLPGGQFLGWQDEYGNTLSEGTIYRFAAREDCVVIAKFTDVDFYTLALKAKNGGTIDGQPGDYCAGTEISLTATAQEGYRFVRWKVSGVSIDSSKEPEITFTMPDEDVTVTAVFEPIDGEKEEDGTSNTRKIVAIVLAIILVGVLIALIALLISVIKKNKQR